MATTKAAKHADKLRCVYTDCTCGCTCGKPFEFVAIVKSLIYCRCGHDQRWHQWFEAIEHVEVVGHA